MYFFCFICFKIYFFVFVAYLVTIISFQALHDWYFGGEVYLIRVIELFLIFFFFDGQEIGGLTFVRESPVHKIAHQFNAIMGFF
jgi:hypothetical protein